MSFVFYIFQTLSAKFLNLISRKLKFLFFFHANFCDRESSSAHPHCLLALAALAVVATQHYLSLGKDTANIATLAPECVSQQRWVRQVVESLLLVIDSSYRADERIFSWCQKVRGESVTGLAFIKCFKG